MYVNVIQYNNSEEQYSKIGEYRELMLKQKRQEYNELKDTEKGMLRRKMYRL